MTEPAKPSKLASFKNCPVCGKPYETGFVTAPRGIYWDVKEHKYTIIFSEAIISQWTWNMVSAPSLRCRNCGIVIFDYETKTPPEAYFKQCDNCGEKIPIAAEYCPKCGTKQKKSVES